MAKVLELPAVAAGSTEAVLAEWMVHEDAAFEANDVLATVETEKALVEVEADAAGVVLKALVPAGALVEVGAPIAVLGEPGEQVDDLDALMAELGVSAGGPVVRPERRDVPDPDKPEPHGTAASNGGRGQAGDDRGERIFISPLARRLAREAGLAPADITGTGPNGRIVRRDVDTAIAARTTAATPAGAAAPPSAAPAGAEGLAARSGSTAHLSDRAALTQQVSGPALYIETPHSRIRRATASRLAESMQQAPHFYLRGSARVDRLLRLRRRLAEAGGVRISVNDLIVKAVARAHVAVPEMNVAWTPDAVRSYSSVDVGIAVATERGLLTPVLRGVESTPISAVATGIRDLADRAGTGRLRQDELDGGTITVTNLGMYGVEEFSAIINPPQSAILAVGAARPEPVVDAKGRLKPATVIRFTLSVDHRPLDGVVAARWMRAFVEVVENPLGVLV